MFFNLHLMHCNVQLYCCSQTVFLEFIFFNIINPKVQNNNKSLEINCAFVSLVAFSTNHLTRAIFEFNSLME